METPNTGNYLVGKGVVFFTPSGGTRRHMGNVPEFELGIESETLDHFSSMEGLRTKDLSIIIESTAELRMILEEITPENLSLVLLSEIDVTVPLKPKLNIFSQSSISGKIEFFATNDRGPRWNLSFDSVEFKPSAGFNPISEEWNQLEVTGTVSVGGSNLNTATLQNPTGLPQAPIILSANIVGTAQTGQTLSLRIITIDPGTYTYVWKRAGVVIAGATNSTYVLVLADEGSTITCTITPTNTVGSGDPFTTPPTATVIP